MSHRQEPNDSLRQARRAKSMTQQQVADALGTNHFTVARWESGMAFPSPYFRRRLSELYGQSVEELGLTVRLASLTAPVPGMVSSPHLPDGGVVGRAAFLAMLRMQLLEGGENRTIALAGLPGVGKTTLLAALATDPELRPQFPSGILWAGLGPQPHLTLLLQGWGAVLGISPEELATLCDLDTLCHRLQARIGQQALLILIDDVWHIEQALACKVGGPNCAVVLTTRSLALATQFAPHATLNVPELDMQASRTLLHQLAPQAVVTEPAATEALLAAIGGLPLALTLIGHYLHQQAVGNQPRRIQAALQALQDAEVRLRVAEPLAPTERPPAISPGTLLSIHTALALSDEHLPAAARQMLHALAVLPPKPVTFDEALARALSDLSDADVALALDALIDAGLVECVAPDAFMLHQLIADYGRTFPHQAVIQRWLMYAITFIEQEQDDYEGLAAQFVMLSAALEHAAEHDAACYIRGVIALAPFLNSRAMFAQINQSVQRALALATDDGSRAVLFARGATAQKNQGNYAQALAWGEEGLVLARPLSDPLPYLLLVNVVSEVLIKQGQTQRAETLIREGLIVAGESEDQEIICRLLTQLAQVEERQNAISQAETHLLQALQMANDLGMVGRVRASTILVNLGVLRGKQGDFSGSAIFSRQGLVLARQLGYFERTCGLLINLSQALRELGQLDEAETALYEAATIAREHGLRVRLCGTLSNLSVLLAVRGAFMEAEDHVKEGLMLAYELGSFERIAGILTSRVHIALLRGDLGTASLAITEGLNRAREAEDTYFINTFLCQQGEVLVREGRFEEAASVFQEAVLLAEAGHRQQLRAWAYFGLAQVAKGQGHLLEAAALGEASLQYYQEIGHRRGEEVAAWMAALNEVKA